MKETLCTVAGIIGGYIIGLLGGWDVALRTLAIFMAIDYLTGCIVAGVFKKSRKTKNGNLSSGAGFMGLCRKGTVLLVVLVAARLDELTGSNMIRSAVIIGYTANEAISILENAGMMGLPIPDTLRKAIDLLTKKGE